MKKNINIPDEILIPLKIMAAKKNISLTKLIEEILIKAASEKS